MPLDGGELAKALGQAVPLKIHHELCRREISSFEAALAVADRDVEPLRNFGFKE